MCWLPCDCSVSGFSIKTDALLCKTCKPRWVGRRIAGPAFWSGFVDVAIALAHKKKPGWVGIKNSAQLMAEQDKTMALLPVEPGVASFT